LPWDQALGLIQKGPQVLCLVVSFRPVVASLGPLDGLFYLKDSFFQSISFTAKGQFMSSKF